MPARKYWLKVMPGPTLPLNAEPKTTSSSTGRSIVKNAASRSRENILSSMRTRRSPMVQGRAIAGRPRSWSSRRASLLDR